MLSWTNARRMGHRLLSATLRCRQCSRPAGELVGFADRSLGEARFLPLDTGGGVPFARVIAGEREVAGTPAA